MTERAKEPLQCRVIGDRLEITIGVETLGFAVTQSEYFTQVDNPAEVTDALEFAKAIAVELNAEDEEGSTRIHMLFDEVAELAVESGCSGIRTDF